MVFTDHPQDSKCSHTLLNLQENQRSVAHHRTQPLQYTVLLNLHHRTQTKSTSCITEHSLYSQSVNSVAQLCPTICDPMNHSTPPHKPAHICIHTTRKGPLPAWAPLGSLCFQNDISNAIPLLLSVKTCNAPPNRCGVHPCVPKSQEPFCQRFPLLLSKLHTQVNQLHLSVWSICYELSHTVCPLRMPALGHNVLMHHFLLYNGPLCQAGTCSLITFIITVTYHLAVRDAGFFRATGFLL